MALAFASLVPHALQLQSARCDFDVGGRWDGAAAPPRRRLLAAMSPSRRGPAAGAPLPPLLLDLTKIDAQSLQLGNAFFFMMHRGAQPAPSRNLRNLRMISLPNSEAQRRHLPLRRRQRTAFRRIDKLYCGIFHFAVF